MSVLAPAYVSLPSTPRGDGERLPDADHVVVVDDGRTTCRKEGERRGIEQAAASVTLTVTA